jgi:hypothetical protein
MTEGTGKGEDKGFKVEDRRRFSDTGEAKEDNPTVDTQEHQARGTSEREKASTRERKNETAPPEINFSAFVISLSTQALIHLGEVASPVSGEIERDLSVAKQMIDILGVLREKTRGNLDPGEEKLLEDALYDLRIRYVEAVKRP